MKEVEHLMLLQLKIENCLDPNSHDAVVLTMNRILLVSMLSLVEFVVV